MAVKRNNRDQGCGIGIDYEKFRVADIMSQIKKKSSSQTGKAEDPVSTQTGSPLPPQDEGQGGRSKFKATLLKIMKPFSPLIKLLVFPVHQEAREALDLLDRTNRRLDHMYQEQMKAIKNLEENLYRLNMRIDEMSGDSDRAKEYIKLLHNLSHNLVVEMTKLKIEEESLKIKTRTLERSLELIGWKEKALEKKILQ